jgi:hypothetical protein
MRTPVAVGHFRQGQYPAVISRYLQTSPDWHVLAVQEAPLMLDPDTFVRSHSSAHLPDGDLTGPRELLHGEREWFIGEYS